MLVAVVDKLQKGSEKMANSTKGMEVVAYPAGHSPGRHQVVVIVNFHKGLYLGPLGNLLLAHAGSDFAWVTINASHQGMAIRAIRGAIINIL